MKNEELEDKINKIAITLKQLEKVNNIVNKKSVLDGLRKLD